MKYYTRYVCTLQSRFEMSIPAVVRPTAACSSSPNVSVILVSFIKSLSSNPLSLSPQVSSELMEMKS